LDNPDFFFRRQSRISGTISSLETPHDSHEKLERKTNNAQYSAIKHSIIHYNTTQAMTCRGRGKKTFRESEEANIFFETNRRRKYQTFKFVFFSYGLF